ncbi:GTP-binding protein [Thermus thermophilus]|uniref:GTP-binding protein n=1 Tax=Thermus thermophilus TaxID=274 RepID=UPI001FCD1250|nr:GTP-binding protein [Thermus thermophilus]BDG22615.1 hypothetical protein TthSNM17_22770 [Thermus thermophilus]
MGGPHQGNGGVRVPKLRLPQGEALPLPGLLGVPRVLAPYVLRAKGFVRFADRPSGLLSFAGKSLVLEMLAPQEEDPLYLPLPEPEAEEPTEIVFIGQGLLKRRRALEEALDACLA